MNVAKTKITPETPKKGKATVLSQKVAEVLMNLRQSRQMSQRAFAEHIGVSFQQYQKYEKGRDRLSLEKAMLLCSQLGLPLDIFMDNQGEHPSYGFAESGQEAFGTTDTQKLSKDEREILDIFAQVPVTARHDFLETLRQLAKMTSKKS